MWEGAAFPQGVDGLIQAYQDYRLGLSWFVLSD
jgi:hypothetical protein